LIVLRLRFKNIHSLKGEHFLDFTVPPLVDAGLFAIIGPTGAGKSTLLDVITLALFNKIPRFASKGTESISKPEIEKMGSVMTHFTDDAYAEIEYQTHQGVFRSKWSISKARTGNLKDYEMQLSELIGDATDGIIFDLKKSQVPDKNEQLLGLKYEQFIRSILLSQGDFARLLRSDDKERAALLEDITDTGIYREIGKKTFEVAKEKRLEIEKLRAELSFYKYLSDEDIDAKLSAIAKHQETNQKLGVLIEDYNEKIKNISHNLQLNSKLKQIKINIQLLQEKKLIYASKAEKLKKHQALDIYREQFSVWQMDKMAWQRSNEEVGQLQVELKKVTELFSGVLSKMATFTSQEVTDENFMIVMKQFEQQVNQLDAQLGFIKENGLKARERLHQVLDKDFNRSFVTLANIKPPKAALNEVELQISQLQTIAGYESLDVLVKQKEAATLQKDSLLLTQNIVLQLEKKNHENVSLSQQIAELAKTLSDASELLSFREKELFTIDQDIAATLKEKEKWLELATMDDYREILQDGKPCPLCGSLHHPYAEELPVKVLDIELHLKAINQKANIIQESIKALNKSISRDQSTIDNHKIIMAKNQEEVFILTQQNGNNKLSSKDILIEINKLEKQLTFLTQKLDAQRSVTALESIHEILKEIHQLLEEHLVLHAKRQSIYKGTQVTDEANMIQNQYIAMKASAQRLTATISSKESDGSRIYLKWTEMSKELEKDILKQGYQTIEDAIQNLLPDDVLRQIINEKEALSTEETSLLAQSNQVEADLKALKTVAGDQVTLDALKNNLVDMQKEKDTLNNLIGAAQSELEHDAQQRKNALKLKTQIDEREKQANPYLYLNELIGDQTGNKYAKFAQNISLKHLIYLANQRLIRLTDRYVLKMTEIEEDFRVMDLYQAGIDRSVKTLSGGETFIVSLALALSLSDMASQNVKLESLFIDEGFGTLDQDTLETAMLTLEKLQSESNRSIGIISHVDSLKERITTQIRVHKNSQGYSELEVV
jgi:exonuclease SbcC